MKNLFLIFLTILSVNVYSQKGFYLRPLIENKYNINPGHPYDMTTLQGYTIHVFPMNFYACASCSAVSSRACTRKRKSSDAVRYELTATRSQRQPSRAPR